MACVVGGGWGGGCVRVVGIVLAMEFFLSIVQWCP